MVKLKRMVKLNLIQTLSVWLVGGVEVVWVNSKLEIISKPIGVNTGPTQNHRTRLTRESPSILL